MFNGKCEVSIKWHIQWKSLQEAPHKVFQDQMFYVTINMARRRIRQNVCSDKTYRELDKRFAEILIETYFKILN